MKTKILAVVISTFLSVGLWAQKGNIKATINDGNDEPLSFATAVLMSLPDSTIIKGASANEEGKVYFNNIEKGNYVLLVSYIGFEKQTIPVMVNEGSTTVLNDITLANNAQQLSEVVVKAEIGATQISPGKIMYKAADLTSQSGGTAGDILKSMPSVAMGGSPNHNRDIRLRGLGNGYTQVLMVKILELVATIEKRY